jgi:DNA-binding CsgD family transcriptional regulator
LASLKDARTRLIDIAFTGQRMSTQGRNPEEDAMWGFEQKEETSASRREADQPAMSRMLSALMDRIECGVLACGPDGELLHANLAAERELAAGRILKAVDGRVQCVAAAKETWAAALSNAGLRHRTNLVSLGAGKDRLTIAAMPMHLDDSSPPAVVILMGRRSVCSALGLEMLANSHGLTYAESRVFRELIGNHTPREIAASHGVAVTTVRTQIQSVRDKLGVRSIDALLLRAAEMPPVFARL